MHAKGNNSENVTKNRHMNVKRRLSNEREDSLSSKIRLANPFNLLNDEMDLDDSNTSQAHTTNRVSPSVLSCPVVQAGTSGSACAPVQVGTSVSVGAVAQAETSVSVCVPAQAGTSVSVCAPVQAETSVSGSGCAPAQPENTQSDSTSEQGETPVLALAPIEAGISSVSVCALAQGGVGSISAPLNRPPSLELIGDEDQTKSSSRKKVESLGSSPSESEDILHSIENKSSPEKAKFHKDIAPGTKPKAKVNRTQEQRTQGSTSRKIKVPNKNRFLEKNDNWKGSSLGKTKASSK